MTLPSLHSPWFVVQRVVGLDCMDSDAYVEYYTSMEDDEKTFSSDAKRAMLFAALTSASRVAEAEGAEIRVLRNEADAKEFGRT